MPGGNPNKRVKKPGKGGGGSKPYFSKPPSKENRGRGRGGVDPSNPANPVGSQPGIKTGTGILGQTQKLHQDALKNPVKKKPVVAPKPTTGTSGSTSAGSRSTGTTGGYTGASGTQRRTVRNPRAVAAGVSRSGKGSKGGGGKRRKAAGPAPKDPLTALVDSIEQAQLAALRGQQQQAEGISSEYQAELDKIAASSQQGWGQAMAAATADGANPTQTNYLQGMFGSNAEGAGTLQSARSAFTRNTDSGNIAGQAANRIGAPGIDGYFSKMKLANATADRESANDFAGMFAQVKAGRPELEQKYRMQAAAAEAAGAKDLFGQQMDQAKLQYQYDALNANTQAKYAGIAAGLEKAKMGKGGAGKGGKGGLTSAQLQQAYSKFYEVNKDGETVYPAKPLTTTLDYLISLGMNPAAAAQTAGKWAQGIPGKPSFKNPNNVFNLYRSRGIPASKAKWLVKQQFGLRTFQPGAGLQPGLNPIFDAAKGTAGGK